MMKFEFEELAGYEVSDVDYETIIEPMYMAVKLSKKDFVKCIDRKRFDFQAQRKAKRVALIKEMRNLAKDRAQNCEYYCDYETEDRIKELAEEYLKLLYSENQAIFYEIDRKHWANLDRGCTYPSDLIIYDYVTEVERIKLARWEKED